LYFARARQSKQQSLCFAGRNPWDDGEAALPQIFKMLRVWSISKPRPGTARWFMLFIFKVLMVCCDSLFPA
jgi:hypothetical protein